MCLQASRTLSRSPQRTCHRLVSLRPCAPASFAPERSSRSSMPGLNGCSSRRVRLEPRRRGLPLKRSPFTVVQYSEPGPARKRAGVGPRSKSYLQVKSVCGACNHGWMSELEGRAEKVIRPLMSDAAGARLDSEAQRTVALWASKTAMVFDSMGLNSGFYTKPEREGLVATQAPPKGSRIWIGRIEPNDALLVMSARLSGAWHGEAAVFTFAVRSLAIQVLHLRAKPGQGKVTLYVPVRPGPWDDTLYEIWPHRYEGDWPPRRTEDIEALHQRYGIGPYLGCRLNPLRAF